MSGHLRRRSEGCRGGLSKCFQTRSDMTVISAPVSMWNSVVLSLTCRVMFQLLLLLDKVPMKVSFSSSILEMFAADWQTAS